jgi:hypothetical protein
MKKYLTHNERKINSLSNKRILFTKKSIAIATILVTMSYVSAGAQDLPQYSVTGGVSYGVGIRSSDPSSDLLSSRNASTAGLSTTNTPGRNQDDGNMNYRKGDTYANVATAYADLNAVQGPLSAMLRVQGWHDFALKDDGVPWGHSPNGYAAGQPLSDTNAGARGKFSNVLISNAWIRGKVDAWDVPVTVTAGNQNIGWRGMGTVAGPMAVLDPVDMMALGRPGAFAETSRIPVTALKAAFNLDKSISVDTFYQFGFQANQTPVCGTFFSAADRGLDGCNITNLLSATVSDRSAYNDPLKSINQAPIQDPSSGGQFGIRTKFQITPKSEVIASVARFHSRSGYSNVVKGTNTTYTTMSSNASLNPQTQTVFPEGIQVFALEAKHEMEPGIAYGSVGYSPNRPIGYSQGEIVQTFTSTTSTLYRSQANAIASGGIFEGWDRRNTSDWQAGWIPKPIKNMLGATSIALRAEVNAKIVHDLPDSSSARYGRPEVFGLGPVPGSSCTGGTLACTNEGYVSNYAWGYSLNAVANYAQVFGQFNMRPRLGFSHNVKGYSYDGLFKEGRKTVALGVDILHDKTTFAIGMFNNHGSIYDNTKDRNYYYASISQRF